MHKLTLALLAAALLAFVAASASAVQAPADQGGGIIPGVGLDSIRVPLGGRKSKLRRANP